MLTRRTLFTGALAFSSPACKRRKASGYSGFAFVANQEGEAVAALDLTVFAVARHIRVAGHPSEVMAHPTLPLVYALTPDNGMLHEIDAGTLAFSRKVHAGAAPVAMRLSPDGKSIYVLCRQPSCLIRFSVESFRVDGRVPLPANPIDCQLDSEGKLMAVSYGSQHLLSLFDPRGQTAGAPIQTGGDIGTVRFLKNSETLIAANLSDRMLSLYQVASRRLIVNLPLAVRPDNLCFNADGGQLFVTGDGGDCVVVVYPYYTPEVAETVLAGHAPGVMAATLSAKTAPQYLFVANPKSGDVSILDIAKRRVVAVTPVGTTPSCIALTPDDRYALVLNQDSGDVAVIRVANMTRAATDFKRSRKGPLFMMIPVGSKPVSAAIVSI